MKLKFMIFFCAGVIVGMLLSVSNVARMNKDDRITGWMCHSFKPSEVDHKIEVLITDHEWKCIQVYCDIYPRDDVCKKKWDNRGY